MRCSALLGAGLLLCLLATIGGATAASRSGRRSKSHVEQVREHRAQRAKRKLAAVGDGTEYFITIGPDLNFYNGCKKFFVAGWNEWEVVEAGAGAPVLYGASLPGNVTGPQLLRNVMDKAVANKLNVMRAFATAVDPTYPLASSPGQYNENMFRGLDYALDQARQRGIKVILSLLDNWANPGGVDQIVGWSGTATARTQFFSDPNCIRLYQQWVQAVITRVNSINGRTYGEDPTIMAWNLVNEPRCFNCPDALQSWIQTQAAYVKSLDSNHLLTVGAEGFYGINDQARSDFANPQGAATWANKEGQDFIANNQVTGIDFASVHSWADNWQDPTTGFQTNWLQQHDLDGLNTLKMPVVVEEFGKWVKNTTAATMALRQQFYTLAYNLVQKSAASGGSLKGIAFWEWFEQRQVAPGAEGYGTGLYGITTDDPVWSTIASFAEAMEGLSTSGTCTPKPASVPAANSCQSTWLDGKPGTGYEGPGCNIDVNECVRGLAGCAANAACTNTPGGFSCDCFWGYSGDGSSKCNPNIQISQLAEAYYTLGSNQLACPEGKDLMYPSNAPGAIDDPTGYTKRQGGFGSQVAVTVQGCEIACELTPGCDSFSYNGAQQACFLKNGGSKTTCPSKEDVCTSSNQNLVQQSFSCGTWQTYYRQAGAVPNLIQAGTVSASG